MWTSDSRFQVVESTYRDSLSLVRDRCAWLTEQDREWMLRKNAEQLFF